MLLDIARYFYITLAGLEIGFLLILAKYRFMQWYSEHLQFAAGMGLLAISFMSYLTGTSVRVYTALANGRDFEWPFLFYYFGLIVLIGGTIVINESTQGVRQYLTAMAKRKRQGFPKP